MASSENTTGVLMKEEQTAPEEDLPVAAACCPPQQQKLLLSSSPSSSSRRAPGPPSTAAPTSTSAILQPQTATPDQQPQDSDRPVVQQSSWGHSSSAHKHAAPPGGRETQQLADIWCHLKQLEKAVKSHIKSTDLSTPAADRPGAGDGSLQDEASSDGCCAATEGDHPAASARLSERARLKDSLSKIKDEIADKAVREIEAQLLQQRVACLEAALSGLTGTGMLAATAAPSCPSCAASFAGSLASLSPGRGGCSVCLRCQSQSQPQQPAEQQQQQHETQAPATQHIGPGARHSPCTHVQSTLPLPGIVDIETFFIGLKQALEVCSNPDEQAPKNHTVHCIPFTMHGMEACDAIGKRQTETCTCISPPFQVGKQPPFVVVCVCDCVLCMQVCRSSTTA